MGNADGQVRTPRAMLYYYLLYFFIAVGAKMVLAVVTIYLLLPADTRCNGCDGDTLLLRPEGLGRLRAGMSLGRVQRRWCPACGLEGLTRINPGPSQSSTRAGGAHPLIP